MKKLLVFSVVALFVLSSVGCVARDAAEIAKAYEAEQFATFDVEIEQVRSGIHLRGYAASEDDKERMLEIAKDVAGKKKVVDEIEIRPVETPVTIVKVPPSPPTDDEVLTAVKKSLQRNQGQGLTVQDLRVNNGTVFIQGEAKSFQAVDQTLARLYTLRGVQDINSEITVNGREYMATFERYKDSSS